MTNYIYSLGLTLQFTTIQVASWGAYLLSRDILAVSFAPRDTHEAQVQFALERGVPALIGVLASIRLPYPSRSFVWMCMTNFVSGFEMVIGRGDLFE